VTSEWESHPLWVYEALACGCPVLIEESVGDVRHCDVAGVYYYRGFDVESIAKGVKALMDVREEASDSGIKCVEESWSWDAVKPQHENLYRQVGRGDYPNVTYLVDNRGSEYYTMASEIKQMVWRNTRILETDSIPPKRVPNMDFSNTDMVVNTVWGKFNHKNAVRMPIYKHVVFVETPLFFTPQYSRTFSEVADRCMAITTTSIKMENILRYTGVPVFYATWGVNTELFHP